MPSSLTELRNSECKLCPLHESAKRVCIMGSGPHQARVAIVGEAPGAAEDEQGRPFAGPSGRLLDKALKELGGIDRKDCYVTNVVKCRPPNNRTPERGEAKVCSSQYLIRELELVAPEYVLLLGNTPLLHVFGKSGITKHHGTLFTRKFGAHSATCMPTIHPAAVLRNPKWGSPFGADIHRLGQLLRGESSGVTTKTVHIDSLSKLRALRRELMGASAIAFDIETYTEPADAPQKRSSFQEWHGDESHIVSIAFTWKQGFSAFVLVNHPIAQWDDLDVLQYLKPALERDDCRYLAHNGKFDCRWLAAKGVNVPLRFDTMLAAHLLEENRQKGLKPLSRVVLGADPYGVGEELKNATLMPVSRLGIYNGKDTDYTYRLYKTFHHQLREQPGLARIFGLLMMPASRALVDIERTGVWIDNERWQTRHDEAREKVAALQSYIDRFVPEQYRPINLNSPAQVGRLLFEHLKLPVLLHTAKGAPSTSETVLLRLAGRHKVAAAIIKYRKWAKYLSTYLLPWRYEHSDANGRIHSNYKLFGTVTGRLSGEGGIQQVPRDPFIRSIIGAPPGWKFVQADFSQVELRIAAMIAGEENMLAQYARGEDIHMIRACRMTGKSPDQVEKEERKKAKAVNFGYIYGMGAAKFVLYSFDNYGLTVSLDEAERDRAGFFSDYPALLTWHARQRRLVNRYRQVQSPLGRIRHLPDVVSGEKEVRAEAERQAINSPVQSMASDLMLFALVKLHRIMPRKQALVLGTVHDSILFQIRDDVVDKWAGIIKTTMEDMDSVERAFQCKITVPIIADIEVGQHWGEGKPWYPA